MTAVGAGDADKNRLFQEQLTWLSQPPNLKMRLDDLDERRGTNGRLNRIFVMGCARSGSWLLTAVMSTFQDVEVVSRELPVEAFGLFTTERPALAIKRAHDSYKKIEAMPQCIGVAYIVRHPFDVLTSHNPRSARQYHVEPRRWVGEMLALEYLLNSQRQNTWVTRYEDLVAAPERIQAELGGSFGLSVHAPVSQITSTFQAPPEAHTAMHGLRPVDSLSVGRFRSLPENIDHLRTIRLRLGRTLDWVGERFGYDLSL